PGSFDGDNAYVTVSAAHASAALRSIGGKTVLGSLTGNDDDWHEALTITFDGSNWAAGAEIYVKAIGDTAEEGPLAVAVSHSVVSADEAVNGFAIQNVLVDVIDDDKPSLVVGQSGNSTTVFE